MKTYTQPLDQNQPSRLDDQAIAKLVEQYIPLVLHQVDRAWLSPRLGLTRDDLVSAGCYGLLLAARRFDPGREIGFGVFARSHVQGAVIREINLAMRAAGLGDEEAFTSSESIEPDSLPDAAADTAPDRAETAQVRELLEYQLTERERQLVTLYYYEELTLAEIAAVLDESESTVSRALKAAVKRLRDAMKQDKETKE